MISRLLATKISLDRVSPNGTTLVNMHCRHAAFLQPVDRFGKIFTRAFVLDLFDRVEVSLESKHESIGFWEPV